MKSVCCFQVWGKNDTWWKQWKLCSVTLSCFYNLYKNLYRIPNAAISGRKKNHTFNFLLFPLCAFSFSAMKYVLFLYILNSSLVYFYFHIFFTNLIFFFSHLVFLYLCSARSCLRSHSPMSFFFLSVFVPSSYSPALEDLPHLCLPPLFLSNIFKVVFFVIILKH